MKSFNFIMHYATFFKAKNTNACINQSHWARSFVSCGRVGFRFMDSGTFITQHRHLVVRYYISPCHLPPFTSAFVSPDFCQCGEAVDSHWPYIYLDMPTLSKLSVVLLLPSSFQLYVNQMVWYETIARDRMIYRYS